jgi:hypothetical protein
MVINQSLPKAERTVLDASPDCGAYCWEGEANGMTVKTIVHDPDLELFVRADLGRVRTIALVDAEGKVHAYQMQG